MPVIVGDPDGAPPRTPPAGRAGRQAGVLVLIHPGDDGEARVVLTERVTRDGHHSGEVSFPGGKAEPHDADLVATALREAAEEVDLDAAAAGVRVVGLLERFWIPVSDFDVTPVLAVATSRPLLVAAPDEVARIVEPPIARFLPGAPIAIVERTIGDVAAPLWRLRGRRAVGLGRDGADPEPARGDPRRLSRRGPGTDQPPARPYPAEDDTHPHPGDQEPPRRRSGGARLDDNLIANNSGNLLFLETAFKVLSTRDAEVIPDRLAAHRIGADEINERFDVYVIPLANAFRASFEETLIRLTAVIERLTIPVVVLGVGVQTAKSHAPGAIRPFDDSVKAFVRAVLDRGRRSASAARRPRPTCASSGSATSRSSAAPRCSSTANGWSSPSGRRSTAMPGSGWASPRGSPARPDRDPPPRALPEPRVHRPGHRGAPAAAVGREPARRRRHEPAAELPLAPAGPRRQVALLRRPVAMDRPHAPDDFVFGTRIHGSIAAVLAGTPSYLLAHDARTLELARYFEIPHRWLGDVRPDMDAADLYDEADFGPLMTGHAARFRTFTDYLERHGLRHVFQPGEDPSLFDAQLAAVSFPPPVRARRPSALDRARHRADAPGAPIAQGRPATTRPRLHPVRQARPRSGPWTGSVGPWRQLADPLTRPGAIVAAGGRAAPALDRVAVVGSGELDDEARISECSVQAACGMSAGQTAASPAAIRVHSSPTPTQPPPSMTMNQVEFGLACGSIRAFRANASSDTVPRPSEWRTWPVSPTEPDRPVRAPVADAEPADLDRHRPGRRPSAGGAAGAAGGRRLRFLIVASGVGVLLLREVALARQPLSRTRRRTAGSG